jgi:hypothetical protein
VSPRSRTAAKPLPSKAQSNELQGVVRGKGSCDWMVLTRYS